MKATRRLAVVLPDLNTWDGQGRSTLEIAKRLSRSCGVDLYSFTFQESESRFPVPSNGWGDARLFRIGHDPERPILARSISFGVLSGLKIRGSPLILSAGACSFKSDAVVVHFVNAAWKEAQKKYPQLAAQGAGVTAKLRRAYQWATTEYNIETERIAFKKNKTYVAVSNTVRKEMERHFGLQGRVRVIHHGVDSGQFAPPAPAEMAKRDAARANLGIKTDDVVFLFVGALARKGLSSCIEALARLPEPLRKKSKLVAVGSGDVQAFQNQARGLGCDDRLIVLPHSKNILERYHLGDVFLLPTLYDPFGLVVLEAMATGLLPIVSSVAGGSELIEHEKNGLLIRNPVDAAEIAGLMKQVLENPAREIVMSQAALQTARTRSWDRVGEEYASLLVPLLERPA